MKRMKLFVLVAVAALLVLCGCSADQGSASQSTDAAQSGAASQEETVDYVYADIVVKDMGTISLELDPSAAPKTVENFVTLAKDGFYDGLTFHRIMSGFMIQGGDPKGNGTGGSGTNIVGEFGLNNIENPLSHTRGTISMARAKAYDSASSQFFIVHADSQFLDGQYAAFGHVTQGMEVVDAICDAAQPLDNNGTIASADQPVIESITIKD